MTNTGAVAASEAVLVFVRPTKVSGAPSPLPIKQIADFGRTAVLHSNGGSETLSFTITAHDVSMVDWEGVRRAYAGSYEVVFSTGGAEANKPAVHTFKVLSTLVLDRLPPPP